MVEFRILRFRVSNCSQDALIQALHSCKELEARIVKRLNSFKGEFLERLDDKEITPVLPDPEK